VKNPLAAELIMGACEPFKNTPPTPDSHTAFEKQHASIQSRETIGTCISRRFPDRANVMESVGLLFVFRGTVF